MAYMVMPADIFFYSKVNQLPIIVYLLIKRTIVYKLNEIAIAMNCQLHSRELNIEIDSGMVWAGRGTLTLDSTVSKRRICGNLLDYLLSIRGQSLTIGS